MFLMDDQRILTFQQQLEASVGNRLRLKINDNRYTMLSVRWEAVIKVSLHRMFLQAPQNIMQALAWYLKGKDKKMAPSIKAYIEDNLRQLDYSHELNHSELNSRGYYYDLQEIYNSLNHQYFDQSLGLQITWFGEREPRRRRRLTLGLYYDHFRLIKINRLLDSEHCPPYFVASIVYHEMLHHLYPAYVDERGFKHAHGRVFKEKRENLIL